MLKQSDYKNAPLGLRSRLLDVLRSGGDRESRPLEEYWI